ncbi:MAG: hypothetical protein IPN71_11435 [Fibrobacteres bacterium]|nr:hypothetical protein [Fibrobacterota bacterium]
MKKPSVAYRFAAVVGVLLVLLVLGGCGRHGFRIRHDLLVTKSGFQLDGKPVDSTTFRDSLKHFCAEKDDRIKWKLQGEKNLTSEDFFNFMNFIKSVNIDCRGLFALGESDPPIMLQSPVPAPRSLYSFNPKDSTKPRASMIVVASKSLIRFWTAQEWLPDVPVVQDTAGMDYVASGKTDNPVRTGWVDAYDRCLVEERKDLCTDSVWQDGTKYVLLGNLDRLPDTVRPSLKKDMDWVVRRPLRRDVAIAAQIHAIRTLPGTLPDNRPYYHGVFSKDMTWESTQRLIIALRHAGVDFNTLELQ